MPIAKSLDLDISDREDRYSDFGTTNNAKVSVRYQPAEFPDLQGGRLHRLPGAHALQPVLAAFPGGLDQRHHGTRQSVLLAGQLQCGVDSKLSANRRDWGLYGGNRNLTPETSQNFDLGVIVAPIQDMGITLDYYRILLKNTIQTVPASAIYGNPTAFASDIVTNSSGTLTPTIAEATDCNPLHGTDLRLHHRRPFRIRAGSRPTGST